MTEFVGGIINKAEEEISRYRELYGGARLGGFLMSPDTLQRLLYESTNDSQTRDIYTNIDPTIYGLRIYPSNQVREGDMMAVSKDESERYRSLSQFNKDNPWDTDYLTAPSYAGIDPYPRKQKAPLSWAYKQRRRIIE